MKKTIGIFILCCAVVGFFSCEDEQIEAGFKNLENTSIFDYILQNDSSYSSFRRILEVAEIDKTLSAYNPNSPQLDYTLFLPDNKAVEQFIQSSETYNSLEDLLNDKDYTTIVGRYHVINQGVHTNDFPFGAFAEFTLSNDQLTVGFGDEQSDSVLYKINGQSTVTKSNIELSNGYIHILENVLEPITYTTYNWLEANSEYSIFKSAVDLTGLQSTVDLNLKNNKTNLRPVTLLVEPDSVYKKAGILSVEDLIREISPENDNYTDPDNPLHLFVAYHVLNESIFLDGFDGISSNYTTVADVPVNINGLDINLFINRGKEVFDTIVEGLDTTIIDYIEFYYDEGNIVSQSGAIHPINRLMKQKKPTRASQYFEFGGEPLFEELGQEVGEFLIEDTAALQNISYSGEELYYVKQSESESTTWNADYISIEGDFEITYHISKIVEGKYDVILAAHNVSSDHALVEVFIDGNKIGGLINLTTGGNQSWPFTSLNIGTVNFTRYEAHTIVVKSLIPGTFYWDRIGFEPK